MLGEPQGLGEVGGEVGGILDANGEAEEAIADATGGGAPQSERACEAAASRRPAIGCMRCSAGPSGGRGPSQRSGSNLNACVEINMT